MKFTNPLYLTIISVICTSSFVHAEAPQASAIARWLQASGLAQRPGFGPSERAQAAALLGTSPPASSPLTLSRPGPERLWTEHHALAPAAPSTCAIASLDRVAALAGSLASMGLSRRAFAVRTRCGDQAFVEATLTPNVGTPPQDTLRLAFGPTPATTTVATAPFLFDVSTVPPAADLPRGTAAEVLLLTRSSAATLARLAPQALPTPSPAPLPVDLRCGPEDVLFPAVRELCGGTVPSADPDVVAASATHAFLNAVHTTWERGSHRGALPPIAHFVHGRQGAWTALYPASATELTVVRGTPSATRVTQLTFPIQTLAPAPTLAPSHTPEAAPSTPSRPANDARLAWLVRHAFYVAFALGGDSSAAISAQLDLRHLASELTPPRGAPSWYSCSPKRGKFPASCTLTPNLTLTKPACIGAAWLFAAGLPYAMKAPPWRPKDELSLTLLCGPDAAPITLLRRVSSPNRLTLTVQGGLTLSAPIDPALPLR